MVSVGDTRAATGVGLLREWSALRGNLRPLHVYTGVLTPPGFGGGAVRSAGRPGPAARWHERRRPLRTRVGPPAVRVEPAGGRSGLGGGRLCGVTMCSPRWRQSPSGSRWRDGVTAPAARPGRSGRASAGRRSRWSRPWPRGGWWSPTTSGSTPPRAPAAERGPRPAMGRGSCASLESSPPWIQPRLAAARLAAGGAADRRAPPAARRNRRIRTGRDALRVGTGGHRQSWPDRRPVDGAAIHLASFSRDPAAATRHYLTATTPQGAVVDLGEFVLTFAPGN